MQKKLLKPGFEFVFALSIIAILGLPPLVLAQNQKNIEISIINGDTTINGKDIKKLTEQERKDALAEMQTFSTDDKNHSGKTIIKRRIKGDGQAKDVIIERSDDNDMPMIVGMGGKDSTHKMFTYRFKKGDGNDSTAAFDYKFDMRPELKMNFKRDVKFNRMSDDHFEFNRRNTQTFNYANTDNDGISTHVSFRVTDPSKEKVKNIAGVEKADLTINDLRITPEFSTGKTTIAFNIAAKTSANVKFTDSNGKLLWSDKAAAGSFSKKISLPLNGIYYLQVKQGYSVAVKKIVKED